MPEQLNGRKPTTKKKKKKRKTKLKNAFDAKLLAPFRKGAGRTLFGALTLQGLGCIYVLGVAFEI